MSHENDDGFTLIELLIVTVIIGILAAIAIPTFLHQRSKAVDAAEKSDSRTIATKFESFYTDQETYPKMADIHHSLGANGIETVTIGDDQVVLSPDDTATINSTANGNAYCILITNNDASQPWVWESDNGGLQPSGTRGCGASYPSMVL